MSTLEVKKANMAGYQNSKNNAIMIKQSIEKGKAPFLPDENGIITPVPIYNAKTGFLMANKDLIPLAIIKQEKGYQSSMVGTSKFALESDTHSKENEKPYYYTFKDRDTGTFRSGSVFFADQMEDSKKFEQSASEKVQSQSNKNLVTIEINNKDEYLAKYIAGCKTGVFLSVSPEVAKDFQKEMSEYCDNYLSQKVKMNEREDQHFNSFNDIFTNENAINKIKLFEKDFAFEKQKAEKKQAVNQNQPQQKKHSQDYSN